MLTIKEIREMKERVLDMYSRGEIAATTEEALLKLLDKAEQAAEEA
jgi:hypothetical protein